MVGPVGVNQCAIPPGAKFTYNFTVQLHGTIPISETGNILTVSRLIQLVRIGITLMPRVSTQMVFEAL
jgi:hypothetical protein